MRTENVQKVVGMRKRSPAVTHHKGKILQGRILVVACCSPRLMRAAQRARFCAITRIASRAALAAKRPHIQLGGSLNNINEDDANYTY